MNPLIFVLFWFGIFLGYALGRWAEKQDRRRSIPPRVLCRHIWESSGYGTECCTLCGMIVETSKDESDETH